MFPLIWYRLNGFMTSTENTQKILITGAGGRTGRRITARLASKGISNRAASRSGNPSFDWHHRQTWSAALDGMDSVYVCYSPDLAFPGVAELIGEFSEAAAAAGVQRSVLLSGRGEEGAQRSEEAVKASSSQWTILRSAWFAQNFSEHLFLEPVRRGLLVLPAGDVREPLIDLDDFADAAVKVLTEPGHHGRVYDLTGPESLSFTEVAAQLSTAIGRTVRYHASSIEEFAAALATDGVPAEEATPLAELFNEILDGRNEPVANDLVELLERPARTFADYVRDAAKDGIWAPTAVPQH